MKDLSKPPGSGLRNGPGETLSFVVFRQPSSPLCKIGYYPCLAVTLVTARVPLADPQDR